MYKVLLSYKIKNIAGTRIIGRGLVAGMLNIQIVNQVDEIMSEITEYQQHKENISESIRGINRIGGRITELKSYNPVIKLQTAYGYAQIDFGSDLIKIRLLKDFTYHQE